jgi:hypothetical protein
MGIKTLTLRSHYKEIIRKKKQAELEQSHVALLD